MAEVMGRLPVIERLVAVLDRRKECRNNVRSEEDVEHGDGFDSVRALLPAAQAC